MNEYLLKHILIPLIPILLGLYFYINRKYSHWAKQGVDGPLPNLFAFGNLFQITGQDPLKVELEMLEKYGKVYGIYSGLKPTLTIADAELIKRVFIKDFPHFAARRKLNVYHEMVNNSLFFTDTEQWKRLRAITSPTFSSVKLRKTVTIMNQCIDKFDNYLDKLTSKGSGVMKDIKDVIIGFSIEVIAATSFGVQTFSNDQRTKINPFVVHAIKFVDINPLRALSYFIAPKWFNSLLQIEHIFNVESLTFFMKTIIEIIKQRKESNKLGNPKQNDLIQLLIDASASEDEIVSDSFDKLTASMDEDFKNQNMHQKSQEKRKFLTDSEILGIASGMFFAGFDSTSLTLSCCLYELSLQPDIQERLYSELCENLDGLDDPNSDNYLDSMHKIAYLDAVIKETLRKYPVLPRLERRLTSDHYKLGDIELERDQIVEISTMAVHYNAEYYPEPKLFNPDRFMPENKQNLVPYTFLPFGDGPHNCLGMRYAYQEMKLFLSQILRRYRFSPTEEDTPKQLSFLPFKFDLTPEPFSVKVEKRN